MINILLGASLPIAMLGIVAFMVYAYVRRPRVFAVATGLAIAAFACVSAVLAAKLATYGSEMIAAGATRYLLFAWCIMVAYFLSEWRFKIRLLGSILMPLALFLMLVACFEDPSAQEALPLPSVPMVVHIILMFAFMGLVVLAFAGAVVYLLKTRALKGGVENALDSELPAITTLKKLMLRPFRAGFPCITLGIILGIIWAGSELEAGWYLEGKFLATLAIWAVYAVYFLLQQMGRLSNRAMAQGIVVIFALTVASFFFSPHGDMLQETMNADAGPALQHGAGPAATPQDSATPAPEAATPQDSATPAPEATP